MADTPRIPTHTGQVRPAVSSRSVIGNIPPSITALPAESLLNATVVRQDGQGNALLQTRQGELTVHSALQLRSGNALVLKLLAPPPVAGSGGVAPGFQAQIVSIDGKAPTPPAGYSGPPTTATGGASVPAYTVVTAVQGRTEGAVYAHAGSATPQQGVATGAAQPQQAAVVTISQGAQVQAVVISPSVEAGRYVVPAGSVGNATGGAAGATVNTGVPVSTTPTAPPAGNTPATPVVKTGDVLSLHVLATRLPAGDASAPAPSGAGNPAAPAAPAASAAGAAPNAPAGGTPIVPITPQPAFTAAVIGTERSGEAVLQTPLGVIKFTANNPLPQGMELRMEVVQTGHPHTMTPPHPKGVGLEEMQILQQHRTTLGEVVAFVQQEGDAAAKDALVRVLPKPNAAFAARVLWFMAGVQSGDAAGWLGPEVERFLQATGKQDALQQLGKDFATLRHLASEGTGSGWNALLFPVMDEEKLDYATLYTRHYGGDEDSAADVRFIVEVNMARFGPMQLDGLVKTRQPVKEFDLFIRSQQMLDEEMRSDISEIFMGVTEAAGLKAHLQFQVVKEFPITPAEYFAGGGHADTILA